MKKKRDPVITSKIMSCVRSKNTGPERLVRKILRKNKLRYCAHYKVVGRPDFVLFSKKIAIFVDGDFWHGNNWRLRGFKSRTCELSSYGKFWRDKIQNNIARDKKINRRLKKMGWKVLRIWASAIRCKPAATENRIKSLALNQT